MNADFETRFDQLPLSGSLDDAGLAWPGYYWANNRGGIAQRWRSNNPQDFKYRSPDLNQLISLSKDDINKLSPAEKKQIQLGEPNPHPKTMTDQEWASIKLPNSQATYTS